MAKKIVVIGAGPAGYPAALKAASLGAEVTVIEKHAIGGVCLNCGCIPSKSLLDAAHRFDIAGDMGRFSDDEIKKPAPSWQKISARRAQVISRLQMGINSLFKAKKINVITGEASFAGEKEVEIKKNNGSTEKIFFDAAIIATGTTAFLPSPFKENREHIYDNSDIFNMPELPKSITIIGGGVIGCEFACVFHSLGTQVTIVEMLPSILPGNDDASVRTLVNSFTKRGIKILTGKKTSTFEVNGSIKKITFEDGSTLESEAVLVAVGRRVHAEGLKLENAGILADHRGIKVDPKSMLVKEHIYAAGDINGIHLLAHAASAQGEVAASNACGIAKEYDDTLIPHAMYTWPEVASVGLSKARADGDGIKTKIYKSFFLANGRALTQDQGEGQIQIVAEEESGKIIGAQIAGADASEMIHIFSVAIKAGFTIEQLKEVVFAHPSLSEIVHEALAK